MNTLTPLKSLTLCYVLLTISLLLNSCFPKHEKPEESDSYKKKLISYKEGTVLFDEYSKTNYEVITKIRNGEPDSRSYWFSLEELEGYINYIKENGKKQNLENLGVRIYLGKYPLDYPKEKMAQPTYAGYQTIFLVPTSKKDKTTTTTYTTRSYTEDENTDIQSLDALNMTNLAPPPKKAANKMN